MRTMHWVAMLLGLVLWGACGEDEVLPAELLSDQLVILRQRAGVPALEQYAATFWAVKGRAHTLEIHYTSLIPDQEGEDFLRLDVPSNALFLRPEGQTFQLGDSVLITVTIDPVLIQVRLEPSGLQFDPSDPVRLRIDYANADDDLNRDGRVDQQDEELRSLRLALWRQSRAGALWERISSEHFKDLEEFEAELRRFSSYALGW